MGLRRLRAVVALAAMLGVMAGPGHAAKDSAVATSGLPIPRYVSLKSDHVNVRAGPPKDNDVAWVYTRSGLPVEITAEFENWRRVRDSEGSEGWVYHSMFAFQQKHSPLGRGVTLEELGGSALYLLSDLSGGVTGETHYVDSGYNIISMPRPETLKE